MRIRRYGRLGAVVTAGTLMALQALAPITVARAPNWQLDVTQLVPGGVSSGAVQGFAIHIVNNGPSNISSLYLVTDRTDAPVYISSGAPCTADATGLRCSFGAVVDNQTIDLTVAYQVPFAAGGTSITFELNTTGLVLGKNNSHGDAKDNLQTVNLLSSGDQAASWIVGGSTVYNSQTLSKQNPQGTTVGNTADHLAVTVEDGSGVSFSCSSCVGSAFGQASRVTVGDGTGQPAPFKVVILERGKNIPGSVDVNTLSVYHILDNGTVDHITAHCTSSDPSATTPAKGCLTASWVGDNLQIVLWVWYNGSFKGYS